MIMLKKLIFNRLGGVGFIAGMAMIIMLFPFVLRLNRLEKVVWDTGHYVFFFFASVLVYQRLRVLFEKKSGDSRYVYVVLYCLILSGFGGAIEFGQSFTSTRHPSLNDAINNSIGVCFGVLAMHTLLNINKYAFRASMFAAGLLLALMPAYSIIYDEIEMRVNFPVLFDLQNQQLSYSRWRGVQAQRCMQAPETSKKQSCGIILQTNPNERFSGASLAALKSNWQEYDFLYLDIWSESNGVLNIRINDFKHVINPSFDDRFNMQYDLKIGWNRIVISLKDVEVAPLYRRMHMDEIESIGLFSSRPHGLTQILVAKVWLNAYD
ncbi:MAG: hypothetical protein CL600_01800 [Alteromonas sp.]|nr:hypothetical protein [Alteromonas sp.]